MQIEKEEVLALVRKYLDTPDAELKAFCHYFVGEIQEKGKTNALEAAIGGVREGNICRLQALQRLMVLAMGIVQTTVGGVKVSDICLEVAFQRPKEMPTAFYFNLHQNGCTLHISCLSHADKDPITVNVARIGTGVGKMFFMDVADIRGAENPTQMTIEEQGSLVFQAGAIAWIIVDSLNKKDKLDAETLLWAAKGIEQN